MKIYTDMFKKPISVNEARNAAIMVVRYKKASASFLTRSMKIGIFKANTIIRLLEDAGVITEQFVNRPNPRTIILKTEAGAVNATLRQLRKGNN